MSFLNEQKIKKIDARLKEIQNGFEAILPMWHYMDRKKKMYEQEKKSLQEQRELLSQGQMTFDGSLNF